MKTLIAEKIIEFKFGKERYNIEFLEETIFHGKGERFDECSLEQCDARKPNESSELVFSNTKDNYRNLEDIPDNEICCIVMEDYKKCKIKIEVVV